MDHDIFGRFDGHVAVITGAASGIGAASMELFRRAGAIAVGFDLEAGPDILSVDVSDSEAVERGLAEVVDRYGRLDIVHGNAGINVPGRAPRSPTPTTAGSWVSVATRTSSSSAPPSATCASAAASSSSPRRCVASVPRPGPPSTTWRSTRWWG